MVRGNSLTDDLRLLVNNPRYSDLEIKCKDDVILHGNRAILAARSEVFDRMLFTRTEVPGKQISFAKIESSSMRIVLEYLHTGQIFEKNFTTDNTLEIFHAADFFQLENLQDFISEYYKRICEKEGNENKYPELLTRAVQLMSPMANNGVINHLVDSVSKIPLDSIEIDRLSLKALECLLLKRDEKKVFVSSEYSVFRFTVLAAAKKLKLSQDASSSLEKRLPPWTEIKESPQTINDDSSIGKETSALVADTIKPVVEHVDFKRINGKILVKIIEPLDIVLPSKLMDSYRFHICIESPPPAFYGEPSTPGVKWDRNGCGPGLNISDDGYTVSASESAKALQSVRTNYPMSSGIHEFHVLIEKHCGNSWVGICGEGLDFSQFAGNQQYGWVIGSTGHVYNNGKFTRIQTTFNENARVVVHLNMDNKTVAFSVNDIRCLPSWTNLPSELYFVASFLTPGRFKILSP